MATVFIWLIPGPLFYGSNLYVTGKRNVLSLWSVIFVLCDRVQSSKITSYFELFWTKYFTYLLNINIMETWTEGNKSSYYEEFRIFKFKLALLKSTKTGSSSFSARVMYKDRALADRYGQIIPWQRTNCITIFQEKNITYLYHFKMAAK